MAAFLPTSSSAQTLVENEATVEDPFSLLPNEMLLHIFSFLDADQLLACGQVCRRWRRLSFDWHLWQVKLFQTHWCTIVCPAPPPRDVPIPLPKNPLHDPSSVHPRTVYRFLSQYIPRCNGGGGPGGNDDDDSDGPPTPPLSPNEPSSSSNLSSFVHAFLHQVRGLLASRGNNAAGAAGAGSNIAAGASPDRPRFALFGPGLDHRWTSRLFWKMVDTHTRSFEPINVFTGHMGFESGITLRLFAQAQHAVMDGSTRCSRNRKASSSAGGGTSRSPISRFTACLSAPSSSLKSSVDHSPPPHPLVQHSIEHPCQCHQHEDFTFDLSYLYSLPPHLKHVFNDQVTRLRVSRLFLRSHDVEDDILGGGTVEDFLSSLEVTSEMREICRKLDGLIYAIDARETPEQLALLYHELRAVLRAFPERIARRIPIVVLYIMPKEDIKFPQQQPQPRPSTSLLLPKPELVNRDSYSGAEYTAAWHDSILLVISTLKLFELPNPWRLQKCSSNDIKTLIQSLMWLNLKYLRPVAVSLVADPAP